MSTKPKGLVSSHKEGAEIWKAPGGRSSGLLWPWPHCWLRLKGVQVGEDKGPGNGQTNNTQAVQNL